MNELIHRICAEYGITEYYDMELITDWETYGRENMPRDWYEGHSYSAGSDTIWLGLYDDPEIRMLSFWHEVGHTQLDLPPYEEWPYEGLGHQEATAWQTGLRLAAEHDITFSASALRWAATQLATYFYEPPEGTDPQYLTAAMSTAGLPE